MKQLFKVLVTLKLPFGLAQAILPTVQVPILTDFPKKEISILAFQIPLPLIYYLV